MSEPAPDEVIRATLDILLAAVAKAADDLRLFHDTVAGARVAPMPPFPRAAVILTERVIERLTKLDQDLEEVLLALGLGPKQPPQLP